MSNTLYKIENLIKTYKDGESVQEVLKGINLEILQGDIIGIVGPSGCGKTTLLNILGLIDKCNEGKIEYKGNNLLNANEKELTRIRRECMGYIFQQYHLINSLTVRQNIAVALLAKNIEVDDNMIEDICEELGIKAKLDKYPHQLSGGEKQRVAIARAIIGKPELILSDEATGNLDRENSIQVMKLLSDTCKKYNIALIYVTHDLTMLDFATRIIKISNGMIYDEKRN